ncbi:MAG: tripartite tricarboxylate transporter TctB family protein [Burkholderiaceae bacterium]
MNDRHVHFRLGGLAILISLTLIFVLIPNWVSSPSNIQKLILSPLFWPYALAGITGITGLGLLFTAWRADPLSPAPPEAEPVDKSTAYGRLAAVAGLMIATMLVLHSLGLVLTSMLVFIIVAHLVHTQHKKTAWLCAVLIPLVLYAFFAHVAGVAIPQGNFLMLP